MNEHMIACPLCGAVKSRSVEAPGVLARKAARPLAAHLAFVHRIPQGRELVCILGAGNEHDNYDALNQWVLEQIGDLDRWPLSSEEVAILIEDLERSLGRVLSGIRT